MEIIILPITQPIRWVNLITSGQKQEIAASSKQHNTKIMHKEYKMRVRSLRLQDFITFLGAGG